MKIYSIEEAVKLAKATSYSKFDGSLDIAINLNIPAKHKNTTIRGSVVLPNQASQTSKVVAVITTEGSKEQKDAEANGADIVGADELINQIQEGKISFDVLIATPEMMPRLAKLGKDLGPKGLMPNPKNGTVTTDISKAVKSYKAGKMDSKVDEQMSVKTKVGKLSQSEVDLMDNVKALLEEVADETKQFGPNRFRNIILCATMGPAIKVDITQLLKKA